MKHRVIKMKLNNWNETLNNKKKQKKNKNKTKPIIKTTELQKLNRKQKQHTK